MDSDSDDSDAVTKPPPFYPIKDEEVDETDDLLVACLVYLAAFGGKRRPKQRCDRIDFQKHACLQSNADMFQRHCHMTPKSFIKLVSLLAPHLQVNEQKAANGGGIVPVKHVVAMGLQHLGGTTVKDLAD